MKSAIIFDLYRTLYDPESSQLCSGARACLKDCAQQHDLFLVSRNEGGREDLIHDLAISDYFQTIHLVEEKSKDLLLSIGAPYSTVWVVGDLVTEEIKYGNECGYNTVWVKQGKFKHLRAKGLEIPKHTILKLSEFPSLL